MVRPLSELFEVDALDIHDYGHGYRVQDYLWGELPPSVDWTIMNPPFRLAEQFIERALATSNQGVAVIVRSAFLEGIGRYNRIFSETTPCRILQFTERVIMHKGVLRDPEKLYWCEIREKMVRPSTATSYCWIIFSPKFSDDTKFGWIPPCRKLLERKSDYDELN